MRRLREDYFHFFLPSENKDEDAHDHIDRVLNIVGLFNIPKVSKDAVMLQVFPFTLTSSAKRWVDRLALGTINTWDLLKKEPLYPKWSFSDLVLLNYEVRPDLGVLQIGIRAEVMRVVMSSASSAVTYTSVYTDSEPGRAFWGADDEGDI
ncbi:hypothetical protein Tco_1468256 [Tanacetum coccineum]